MIEQELAMTDDFTVRANQVSRRVVRLLNPNFGAERAPTPFERLRLSSVKPHDEARELAAWECLCW